MRATVCTLTLLLGATAQAAPDSISLDLRTGVASPGLSGYLPGPAYGLEAEVGLLEQLALSLFVQQSAHAVSGSADWYTVSRAGLGASIPLDATPLVPALEVGLAVAQERYQAQSSLGLWPYVGISAKARPTALLELGADLRYALGTRADGSTNGYAEFVLRIGLGHVFERRAPRAEAVATP